MTKLQLPKHQAEHIVGNFDSHAYGHDALKWLCEFRPRDFLPSSIIPCTKDQLQLVLQGPRLGLAFNLWVETLLWPPDTDQPNPLDWGITWFEMTVSFFFIQV